MSKIWKDEKIYKIEGEYDEREQKLGFGRWITR